MQQLVLIRITKNTNMYDGLLREGDFVLGPKSVINLLVNHSNTWHSTQMGYKVASVEEVKKCRAGHIRFHFFESANLGGFKQYLVSKENALASINSYGLASYENRS